MRLTAILTAASMAALVAACEPATETPPPTAPAAPPATEAPEPSTDANALTAEGWGPLRIGMTTAEVTEALGPDSDPEAVGGPEPEACDQFRPEQAPEGLLVMMEEGVLTRISVMEPSTLRTDRGFGLGSPIAQVKAAYGDDAVVTPHEYGGPEAEYVTVWTGDRPEEPYVQDEAARGVRYETGVDGVVDLIHVGGPSIQYVEGCA